MATNFVPVHPETLRWAREDIGLTLEQAAEKTNFSTTQLGQWERGKEKIQLSQARKLADKYKVSLPTLYLKKIPAEWVQQKPKDFRGFDNREPYSYQLCLAIRDAYKRQRWMREYLLDEGMEPLEWLYSFGWQSDVTEITQWIRHWLEVDWQEIEQLRDEKAALSYWIDKIEGKHIIVSTNSTHAAYKIDSSEYSGLVLYDDYAPLILLNPADSPTRRIFTLIHELSHLLLDDKGGLSQIDFRRESSDYDPLEARCNQIASDVLVDDSLIKDAWQPGGSTEKIISILVSRLKVSHSVCAVKLKRQELISQDVLEELLNHYQHRYLQGQTSGFGRAIPEKQVLDCCGKLLTRSVLSAYEQGSIHATEIYDVLGMKLKYLGKLSNRLHFPLHRWVS